ncbi:MAG TPA: hypothetical protein VK177_07075 [Flavobacteriales bacterium]|nr:hypothetical protein [Flavobacteriales bacterium]
MKVGMFTFCLQAIIHVNHLADTTTANIPGILPGTYTVVATDVVGCTWACTVPILKYTPTLPMNFCS